MILQPEWPAPEHVVALATTRSGGASAGPWASFNLGDHVGDSAQAVAENRRRLQALLPGAPRLAWLRQVHGCEIVDAASAAIHPEADAAVTSAARSACVVLTADCLPVLLCDRDGRQVGAVHAGWRGLAAGIVERAVDAFEAAPGALLAWLGPAIGPAHFEVGAEVRAAFLAGAEDSRAADGAFAPVSSRPGHFLADLCALARLRLQAAGVEAIYGGDWCTCADPGQFFSYRRDGQTGRMASLIYRVE